MHLDARGYAYESVREGGRVCRRYVGSGEVAASLCQFDALDRQRARETKWAAREAQKLEDAGEDELRAFCELTKAVMRAHLFESGFHQHKRGAWRKARAPQVRNPMAKPTKAAPLDLARLDTQTLHSMARNGDSKAAAQLWRETTTTPEHRAEMVRDWGDMAEHARLFLLERMLGKDELARLATRAKMLDMKRDLGGANPSPLESLLVERVVSCWLCLAYFEALYATNMEKMSLAQSISAQKRIDGAHRRYLESIKALASVRKLQLPNVQVNIGEKQVNIGQLNAPTNGAAPPSEALEK